MTDSINYENNPLHGVGLKTVLTELVEHYGFEILYAYLNINCFKTKPSIASSLKFLKKTDWAREKVEAFYLYQFKSLPRASADQFELPPRERIIPDGQVPGEPAELSLEDAERLREKREMKAAAYDERRGNRSRESKWAESRQRRVKGAAPSRPESDKPQGDKPWGDKPRRDKPQGEKPRSESPRRSEEGASQPRRDPWANARKRLKEEGESE